MIHFHKPWLVPLEIRSQSLPLELGVNQSDVLLFHVSARAACLKPKKNKDTLKVTQHATKIVFLDSWAESSGVKKQQA